MKCVSWDSKPEVRPSFTQITKNLEEFLNEEQTGSGLTVDKEENEDAPATLILQSSQEDGTRTK